MQFSTESGIEHDLYYYSAYAKAQNCYSHDCETARILFILYPGICEVRIHGRRLGAN